MWGTIGGGIQDHNNQKAGDDHGKRLCFVVYGPEKEIAGGVMNGDARLIIDAEPLSNLAPQKGDFVLIDGRNWAVLGAHARMTSDNLTSYELWVRGG
jgi:hypothetical protein